MKWNPEELLDDFLIIAELAGNGRSGAPFELKRSICHRAERAVLLSATNQPVRFVESDSVDAFSDDLRRKSPAHAKSPCRWPSAASMTRSRWPLASTVIGSSPSSAFRGVVSQSHAA